MMNSNQKQRKLNRGVTIALAILIAATILVTVIALTASRRSKPGGEQTSSSTPSQSATEQTAGTTETTREPENTTVPTTSTTEGGKPAVSVVEWAAPASGAVIKEYSADIPVFSLTMEDYRIHAGIDIEGDAGDEVRAAADGIIESVYYDPMMGQTVVISHANGFKSVYQNMQTTVPDGVAEGATVLKGQKIGSVGDTALVEISESPHLHFCVTLDGKYVDPLSYVSVSASAASVWYED